MQTEGKMETEGKMQTEGKMETEGKMQTEGKMETEGKMQTERKMQTADFLTESCYHFSHWGLTVNRLTGASFWPTGAVQTFTTVSLNNPDNGLHLSRYFRQSCSILFIMSSKRQNGKAKVFRLQNHGDITTTKNDFPAV